MGKIKKRVTFVLLICLGIYAILFSIYLISEPQRPIAEVNLENYFSNEKIQTGKKYFNERVIIAVIYLLYNIGILLIIYKSKLGQELFYKLTRKIDKIFIRSFVYTFSISFIIMGILTLPLAFISHYHLKSYGIIHTPVWLFIKDFFISKAIISLGLTLILSTAMYFYSKARKMFPLTATIIVSVFAFIMTVIFPVFITPMFNDFKKLDSGELKTKINAFLSQNNVKVKNMYIVDASKRTKAANAYVSGIGATKEIVLYDTLIKNYTHSEILSILAHELGHYNKHHIWIGFFLYPLANPFVLFAFFFTIAYLMDYLKEKNHDPAFHVPVILIILLCCFWIAKPFINSVSRRMERDADITSLKLTNNPKAYMSSEIKLSSQHRYANYSPNLIYKILFYTHPPVKQRLGMGKAYEKGLYKK